MSFLSRLLGLARAPAPSLRTNSQPHSQLVSTHSQQHSVGLQGSQNSTRRELLRVVLRDTLNRHGIPSAWVSAEMLLATSRSRDPGIHWRIVIKHWDPRLMTHGVAFQQALIKRVMSFDPMAASWLSGISWQFALPDESVCPPMPHPGIWTTDPQEAQDTSPSPMSGPSGDVITGPVRIADAEADAVAQTRADLERLMALREDDFKRHAPAPRGHDEGDEGNDDGDSPGKRPMFPATEPARL